MESMNHYEVEPGIQGARRLAEEFLDILNSDRYLVCFRRIFKRI